MQIRFLLGPAGSGKTHRCLAEIGDALRASAEGAPLILLAPKQATFQLERQLLTQSRLSGYTRLHILSFQRLADFVLEQLHQPAPKLLSEEGRLMVLRGLLEKHRTGLRLFRASARLPGFARQLSELLRELQRYHFTPDRLEALAQRVGNSGRLDAKLRDLALMVRAYEEWLSEHCLEDADRLLDVASSTLSGKRAGSHAPFKIAGLWLDGFAQMTPQERRLLAAVVQCTDRSTLAFCLEGAVADPLPWHSPWAPVAETFSRCRDEFSVLPGAVVEIETLSREPVKNRFQQAPMLAHLEKYWTVRESIAYEACRSVATCGRPLLQSALALEVPSSGSSTAKPPAGGTRNGDSVRLVTCVDPEAEVTFAAREIHRHVRQRNARYRDVAVLLRSLEGYHDSIRRVFSRYGIPFFLDRRELVAHHPLAELTRYALRIAAYGWEHDDWFGALKTGLVDGEEGTIDALENEALARGWRGAEFWSQPLAMSLPESQRRRLEELRQRIVGPFQKFVQAANVFGWRLNGTQLAAAVRALWLELKVDRTLEGWSAVAEKRLGVLDPAVHEAVWEQMTDWVRNLELGFAEETLPLKEWLPIVEAGLGNLSVGVIPPALDQVLVGAIDRSRNPDLELVFVLGVNEGIFPAPPPAPTLLTRVDRDALASHDAPLAPGYLQQIGMERYYGYIAFTRARRQVIATFAARDRHGRELNPSAFVDGLRRLFPDIPIEHATVEHDWPDAEHWSELMIGLLKNRGIANDPIWPQMAPEIGAVLAKARQLDERDREGTLPAELADRIFGPELRTSVSGLEEFAACPFKFFVARGLRAEERVEFEVDAREKGSFQHEILASFHEQLKKTGQRWRDVSPAEARMLVRQIGQALLPVYREGLLVAGHARRFAAQMLIESLERVVETLVEWTNHYAFDPAAVEISFGLKEQGLPAWRIDLDGKHALMLRGRIDRVDLCPIPGTGEALAVVVDYKSSARQLDEVLVQHGLELQLLAYLGAVARFTDLEREWNVKRLIPAGGFYVALKPGGKAASNRAAERDGRDKSRRAACQHRGRFDVAHLAKFDGSGARKGEQFRFSIKQDGTLASRGNEALEADGFRGLMARVEAFLQQHGRDIYAGKVGISPFRWKTITACDFCEYRPVCRFDPWRQLYRVLKGKA